MKPYKLGILMALAFVSVVKSEKLCESEGHGTFKIPDSTDCESFVKENISKFRFPWFPWFPSFPWVTMPPRFPTFPTFPPFPDFPDWIRPTRPPPDDGDDDDDIETCPDEGIKQISHPKSCEKYFLCVGGNKIERRCSPGFLFSRKFRSCVPPEMSECEEPARVWECPEEDDLGNLVFLPNKKNCAKYYLCFGGEQIPMACGDGLHWSIHEDTCMDESKAKCEFGDDDDDVEECPDDGIKQISHPDNCEKYILCVNGMRIKRNCAPGFHFSRQFRSCVDPDIAECEGSELLCPAEDDLDDLVFLPSKEDCAKYYVCFGGEPLPLRCADGLHWSVEAQTCLAKKDAGCEDDGIEQCPKEGIETISHPYNCEKYILCVGGTRIKRDCLPGLHFSREIRACVDPDIAECEDDDSEQCPDDGIKSISHPDNCEKYVLCVNGNRFKRNCAPGLHFSRQARACVHPDIAECDDDDIEQCPDEGIKSIAHPESCEKYVLCVNGNRFKRNCPPGLHFSRDMRACADPNIAECEDDDDDIEQCPDEGIKSISHPDNCEKYILCVGGMRIKRNCAPGLHFSRDMRTCADPSVAECEDDDFEQCPDEGIKSISHPDNCEKYILCVGGTRIKRNCAPGLHFSRNNQACVDPSIAECEDFEQCPDEGIKSISHPDNCEKYILCVGGTRIKRNCAPGLHFSRDLRNCVQPDIAECDASPLTCPKVDDFDDFVFLPNKEDCSMYYVCFGGEPIPLSCGDGLHWNVDEQTCTSPAEASCEFGDFEQCPDEGIKSISHPTNCEKYVLCVGGTRLKRLCAPGFHFSRDFRACVPPQIANCEDGEEGEEPFTCPMEDDLSNLIFLPSQESCEKFYLCHRGEKVSMGCGNGLHWSQKNEMCMLPDDAGCK